MRVLLDGETLELRDEWLLGEGGEARVFGVGDRALKVWHLPEDVASAERDERCQLLELSRTKLARFPRGLPANVLSPLSSLRRPGERVPVGYAMRRLRGAQPLYRYGRPGWRSGRATLAQVTVLLRRLHALIDGLHNRGVVVGDLSDTNVLVGRAGPASTLQPYLIDTDSMQFAGLACPVAQRRTLDPRLFGVALAEGPAFSPETDWYAFAVLAVSCLLHVHPFGGAHPTYPTLLRRAEAGHSIFRGDVVLPKVAGSPSSLPAPLREHLSAIFDAGWRGRFPLALLALDWRRCQCGRGFAGATCPCQRPAARHRARASAIRGRCRATEVLSVGTELLDVAHQGRLLAAWAREGSVCREDGQPASRLPSDDWPVVRVVGSATWLADDRRVECWRGGQRVFQAACDQFGGEPAFDASARGAWAVRDGWLIELPSGRRYGRVRADQSWLAVGDQLGVGFCRAGRVALGFLFELNRPGLRWITLPAIEGRLLEIGASLGSELALLELVTEERGRRRGRVLAIDRAGRLVAERRGSPGQDWAVAHPGGKAVVGDRVLVATDEGLRQLLLDPIDNKLLDGPRFVDTEPFVSAASRVFPGPGGSVFVAEAGRVVHLTLTHKEPS